MFCPECGTQNADSVYLCVKCGFKLRDLARQHKGTMMMQQVSVDAPSEGPSPTNVANVPAAPAPSAAPAVPARGGRQFKGTMMGMAPAIPLSLADPSDSSEPAPAAVRAPAAVDAFGVGLPAEALSAGATPLTDLAEPLESQARRTTSRPPVPSSPGFAGMVPGAAPGAGERISSMGPAAATGSATGTGSHAGWQSSAAARAVVMPVARGDAFRSKSDALASSGPKGTVRSEVVEGLLCFLPFYTLVWLRRALKEAKDFSGEDLPSPWVLWGLSVLTFGFYGMYWRVSQGGALLQRIQQRAGVQNAGNLALVLAVPFVWPALMQAQLNKAWDARG